MATPQSSERTLLVPAWRVPLVLERVRFGGETTEFDGGKWTELDAAAETARQAGDPEQLAAALGSAHRPAEAHAAWTKVTEAPDAPGHAWVARGFAALSAGDAADAVAAFRRAREVGEPLPAFITASLAAP